MGTDFEGKSNFCYGLIGQPRSGLVPIFSGFCSVWLFPVSICLSVSFVFCQSVGLFTFCRFFLCLSVSLLLFWLSVFCLSVSLSLFVFLHDCMCAHLFCLPISHNFCPSFFFSVCLSVFLSVCLLVCLIFPSCPRRSNRYFRFSLSVLQFSSRHFCFRPVLKKKKMFNRGQPPKYWEQKYFINLLSYKL